MNSISESLRPPETSSGRAANGNCVVARRGGEQPAAELRSQTKVNQIRLRKSASLLGNGEARRASGIQSIPLPSSTGWGWDFRGGCGENAVKGSCVSNETCLARNGLDPVQVRVRASIVALNLKSAMESFLITKPIDGEKVMLSAGFTPKMRAGVGESETGCQPVRHVRATGWQPVSLSIAAFRFIVQITPRPQSRSDGTMPHSDSRLSHSTVLCTFNRPGRHP